MGDDTVVVSSTDGARARAMSDISVPRFLSACVYPVKFGVEDLLSGLPNVTKGVLGLARTSIALPTQLASKYKVPRKFAICLPSSSKNVLGNVFVGGGPYYMPPLDVSKFLVTTPLVVNPVSTGPIFDDDPSTEYFIDVKSIKVDGKVVNFNTSLLGIDKQGNGGTKISTVIPYTKLQSSIYKALVEEFVKKAGVRKIKRVKSVKPFGACFDARTIGKSRTGAAVPIIDVVVGGGGKWRMYGGNSMVKVGKSVMCLGFVDGGVEPSPIVTSIIIGGHQLEDNLVEFDLVSGKFGFTSSLLLHNATCSHNRVF